MQPIPSLSPSASSRSSIDTFLVIDRFDPPNRSLMLVAAVSVINRMNPRSVHFVSIGIDPIIDHRPFLQHSCRNPPWSQDNF